MRGYLFCKIAGAVCIGVALWFGYLMVESGVQAGWWKRSGDQQRVSIYRAKSFYCTLGLIAFFMPGIIFLLQEKPRP
jgi:hypothetical protein